MLQILKQGEGGERLHPLLYGAWGLGYTRRTRAYLNISSEISKWRGLTIVDLVYTLGLCIVIYGWWNDFEKPCRGVCYVRAFSVLRLKLYLIATVYRFGAVSALVVWFWFGEML